MPTTKITTFAGNAVGEPVDDLIFQGGLQLDASITQGGFSGIALLPDNHFVMVSDRGQFLSGQFNRDENGQLQSIDDAQIEPITNSKGVRLPTRFSSDAEAIDVIVRNGSPAAIRVGFENLTRVADFDLKLNRPIPPAREVGIPNFLTQMRTNESIESLCIAPPTSPIAGSTLLLTEGDFTAQGNHVGFLLGNKDRGPISLKPNTNFRPTDCVFLPNGDLLILQRAVSLLGFGTRILQVEADEVQANRSMTGEVIFAHAGGEIDNMEGIAWRTTEQGKTHIIIVSDNNFNDWQRSIILEFELPDINIKQL